ncbi:MAG: helix-turn-helix domain-containing protein [Holosporaceae bacterium]|jgi:transcriptional regulator with XRE-family HTH domain|nr:helix-turn-helix domain-containing protein [Holosporaceae bacterium]
MANYVATERRSRKGLDSYIGSRVKSRRSFLGISQEKLGNYLGITFQQVQKYEKGANRISASMLYDMASALSVDFSYFTEGYKKGSSVEDENSPSYHMDQKNPKETTELLRHFCKINDPAIRKKIVGLVKSIAATEKSRRGSN